MKKFLKILSLFILIFAGVVVAGFYVFPWKGWLEGQIKQGMVAKGLEVANLNIADIGFHKITLRDVKIGEENPITLKSLAIGYTPLDLIGGKIEDIIVEDLMLYAHQDNGVWAISGIKSSGGGALVIPDTEEAILGIPVSRLKIDKSMLFVKAGFGNLELPFEMFWDKGAREVLLSSRDINFEGTDIKASVQDLRGVLNFKDGKWKGTWSAEGLVKDVAGFAIKGTLDIKDQILNIGGDAISVDSGGKTSFAMTMPLDGKTPSKMVVTQGEMPWSEGFVRLKRAEFSIDGKTPIRVALDVEKISLAALMKLMTGKDISATGTISGTVPVIVKPDGSFTFEKSRLSANGKGVISVPSDLIPGVGSQIDLTRQVLDNFAYDGLSIDVVEEPNGKIVFVLALSGNNPKVYDGRAVKLNVRLGGDVLEFLQSNIMMLTKPESILDQETK